MTYALRKLRYYIVDTIKNAFYAGCRTKNPTSTPLPTQIPPAAEGTDQGTLLSFLSVQGAIEGAGIAEIVHQLMIDSALGRDTEHFTVAWLVSSDELRKESCHTEFRIT